MTCDFKHFFHVLIDHFWRIFKYCFSYTIDPWTIVGVGWRVGAESEGEIAYLLLDLGYLGLPACLLLFHPNTPPSLLFSSFLIVPPPAFLSKFFSHNSALLLPPISYCCLPLCWLHSFGNKSLLSLTFPLEAHSTFFFPHNENPTFSSS